MFRLDETNLHILAIVKLQNNILSMNYTRLSLMNLRCNGLALVWKKVANVCGNLDMKNRRERKTKTLTLHNTRKQGSLEY